MAVEERICFVIMPFSDCGGWTGDRWTQFFDAELAPVIEGRGYRCVRSTADRGNILKDIVQYLASAHVVLADLTGLNPNVLYELGIRHSLSRRTLMITQGDPGELPFDLKHYGCRQYSMLDPRGQRAFGVMLEGLFAAIDQEPTKDDSPVADFATIATTSERERDRERTLRLLLSLDIDLQIEERIFQPEPDGSPAFLNEEHWNPFAVAALQASPASASIRAEGITGHRSFLFTLRMHRLYVDGLRVLTSAPHADLAVVRGRSQDVRALNKLLIHQTRRLIEALREGLDTATLALPGWADDADEWRRRVDDDLSAQDLDPVGDVNL